MSRTRGKMPAVLAFTCLLTACGSAENQVTQDPPTHSPPTMSTAKPTSNPHVWTLGEERTIVDDEIMATFRVTANEYRATDTEESVLGVTFCLDEVVGEEPEPVTVSWQPWAVRYADGRTFAPASSWAPDLLPKPLYPSNDFPVRVGTCVKGFIPFSTPKDETPSEVMYVGSIEPLDWSIPDSAGPALTSTTP